MVVLDIHFEKPADTSYLTRLLERKVPFVISIAPVTLRQRWYDNYTLGLVKEVLKNPDVTLGQQGLYHKCHHVHKYVDPWHENHCLWKSSPNQGEQIKLIRQGKRILEGILERTPEIYIPPNHLYNKDTVFAAEEASFCYLAENAVLSLKPYERERMIIIPESKVTRPRSEVAYIHYDEIEKLLGEVGFRVLLNKDLESFKSFAERLAFNGLTLRSKAKIKLNRALLKSYKIVRDLRQLGKR